jgi:hypothetical protein
MPYRARSRQSLSVAVASAAVVVCATMAVPAHADEIDRCLAAHTQSQRLRIAGKLRAARDALLVCAAEACPAIVRAECGQTLEEVKTDLPSVVVDAKDASGKDVVGVTVAVDGAGSVETFRGNALSVDPGTRTFRFEAPGRAPIEQQVVVRQGEKNRVLSVTFPSKEASHTDMPPAAESRPVPLASMVLGGVALLGAVGFGAFALSARSDVEHLRETCEPRC